MADTMEQDALPEYVLLISSDGYEFPILRRAAMVSGTLRRMLDPKSGFRESREHICRLESLPAIVLEKVCEYLYYNVRHQGQKAVPDLDLPAELALELALAADYLDC